MAQQPLLHEAIQLHQAGRLAQAEALYRRLLDSDSNNADALNLLGTLERQRGRPDAAVELIRKAIDLKRNVADYHFNFAEACRSLGRLDDAVAAYHKAVQLGGPDPEAFHGMGAALSAMGKDGEAIAALHRALQMHPGLLPAYGDLAACLVRQRRLDEAMTTCRRAIAIAPADANAHFSLGGVLMARGEYEPAAAAYRRATGLRPDWAEAYVALAAALDPLGRLPDAEACCRRAVELSPHSADAHNVLGIILNKRGRITDAAAAYAQAVRLKPDHAEAQANLANVLKQQGLHEEAIAAQRRAMELSPDSPTIHSNWLMLLNYVRGIDDAQVFAEHVRWGERHAARVAESPAPPRPSSPFSDGPSWRGAGSATPHGDADRDFDPDRPLRMGYVSPDLREHPVRFFLEPILAAHDHARYRPIIYSDVARPDAVTRRLRELAADWRDVRPLNNAQLADLVRRDAVDILVDLAGHTADNRLMMFARTPAPVQVSYLGYPNTTGLSRTQITYRLTDAIADPPGRADDLHTEELMRLSDVFICYQPPTDAPDVAACPCRATGYVTFGSFNATEKLTAAQIGLWAQVLRGLPGSRLMLKNKSLGDCGLCDSIRARFASHGVDPARLVLAGPDPTSAQHLARYREMDVALDTFPYGGTTTTCEALWMGVPVVTLAGSSHRSRVGASLLTVAGLPELIATTPEQYVETALGLAADAPRLQFLRDGLRGRIRSGALTDSQRFTRNFEAACRRMWHARCYTARRL